MRPPPMQTDRRASRSVAARVLWSFLPGSVPAMARANYRREALSAVFLPFALAATEGSIISVLVRVAYEGRVDPILLNLAVGVLAAAPAMANITSFVWVRLSHGLPKIPFINALQVAVVVMVLAIAACPRTGTGLVVTTLSVVLGRAAWTGLITLRSTVWRYNYRRDVRARITGKITTIQVVMMALLGIGLGQAMDLDERAFRVMLPVGAALGLVGVWHYSRIRVRHEWALLASEKKTGGQTASFNPWSMVVTLREDRAFARFMAAQFLLGMGNMMALAPLVLIVREQFGFGYLASMVVVNSIPLGLMPVFIPFWARLIDRSHIVRFRIIHCWSFVLTLSLMFLGITTGQVWLVVLGAIAKGAAFGGATLAWNLGHLDYAPKGKETQYMGVHVTLTGVRGALAPMVGVTVYTLAASSGFALNPGTWTYAMCLVVTLCGTAAFFVLAGDPALHERLRSDPIEAAPPSRSVV
ncbi:MAG: MFS transporter [Phycisphaeraceae bacterium]|nr:MFS transporter [Phycisphaeraceae bacterium]